MKTKSLLIPGDFPPVVSGIATYFYEIWRHFPTENCIILAPRDANWRIFDSQTRLNVIRCRVPSGNGITAKLLKGLRYAFLAVTLHLRYRFTVIHCGQVLSSGFAGWLLNRLFGVPYVVYVYGSETFRFGRNPFWIKAIRMFLLRAAKIIPNSRFTQSEFEALGISSQQFLLVTPGVDTQRFYPTPKDPVLSEHYHLQDKIVLLTVARLDERKGHDNVIRAVARLQSEFSNLVYLIVGKGREDQRLRELARQGGVEQQVIFCGYVSDADLPRYYNLADIFVLLNRQTSADPRLAGDYEGFGIVFLEASACAKPVVAGNFGGIADAVEDQRSGLIIDGNSLPVITATMRQLITDRHLRQRLGEFGLRRARQQFDWTIIADQIKPLL